MQFSLSGELLIILSYWGFLHWNILDELESFTFLAFTTTVLIHFLPFVAALGNCIATNISFVRSHYIYSVHIGVAYMIANFIAS